MNRENALGVLVRTYFGFWPNFSFNLNPPPGVDGVAGVAGFRGEFWGAGEESFGICSFGVACGVGVEVWVGAFGPTFDCLNVIRGPGGGIPCSSRLRFVGAAFESFEGARVVRTRLDR